MIFCWKSLLGGNSGTDEKVKKKAKEARDIKGKMYGDALEGKRRVDAINLKTYRKLLKISNDLADTTAAIAIAVGAKK